MRPDILILGQGLAGTVLGWELERVGIAFAIADAGHAQAATTAAAGIVNPITGRRLVKSWRIDTLLPQARATFREIERRLGVPLWHPMRLRRLLVDERERTIFQEKARTGELAPFAGGGDDVGFWIHQAARVDLPRLLTVSREYWRRRGQLKEESVELEAASRRVACVVDCRGLAATRERHWAFVPWEYSKGEVLEVRAPGFEPDLILNARHWAVPVGPEAIWVGATNEPGVTDPVPTDAARASLEVSARRLLGPAYRVIGQRAGVRVGLPDKRPVAGVHPESSHVGLLNGLGAKGVLWAPLLAQQWTRHLVAGATFDAEVGLARFGANPRQ